MKDLISATSLLFASVILVICVFQDVNFESALLRAGISFLSTYSIGIVALALFKVTIKTEKNKNNCKSKRYKIEVGTGMIGNNNV